MHELKYNLFDILKTFLIKYLIILFLNSHKYFLYHRQQPKAFLFIQLEHFKL